MDKNHLPFGEYVKQRRESLKMTMRDFAEKVQISPAYLCDIEKGNRKPPVKYLEKIAEVLQITNAEELNAFYDSAGVSKNGQHSDINTYIDGLPSARMALRTAKDKHFTDEDWLMLVEIIKNKK
jgi:transcriptional regulator with XRE-family HTH domain